MKTIILGTDFSSTALNASRYAADMALAIHAELYILHVCAVPLVYSEMPAAINVDDIYKDAELEMIKLKKELYERTHNSLIIHSEIRWDSFFVELKNVCEKVQPYTVIIGNQGRGASESLFFGSHTLYSMKYLEWPTIAVPKEAHFHKIQRVGLACDYRNVVETLPIMEIKRLVKDLNAKLDIIHVQEDEHGTSKEDIKRDSQWMHEAFQDLNPEYFYLKGPNIEKSIVDFADHHNLDLLVIIPKEHSLLSQIFQHSKSRKLVLQVRVPTLALHI